MKLISHRGIFDNKVIIENTCKSIKKAFESDKYAGVEFDVRITKDNIFVVYHDAAYEGKLIKNMYYRELPKYIPKLKSILKIRTDKIFLVEIKYIDDKLDDLVDILNKYSNKKIYVTSFNTKLIENISHYKRNFKVGILNYVLNSTDVNYLDFICILDTLLNDQMINTLNYLERDVFSYGIINKNNIGIHDIYYIVDDYLI